MVVCTRQLFPGIAVCPDILLNNLREARVIDECRLNLFSAQVRELPVEVVNPPAIGTHLLDNASHRDAGAFDHRVPTATAWHALNSRYFRRLVRPPQRLHALTSAAVASAPDSII